MIRSRGLLISIVIAAGLAGRAIVAGAQPPAGIESVFPHPGSTGVYAGDRLRITFSEAMDRSSVESAFAVDPAAPGEIEWVSDIEMHYFPGEPLANATEYAATLGVGARTRDGRPLLSTAYTWRFTTWAHDPTLRFSYYVPAQHVPYASGAGVPVQMGYPRLTLDVTVYALDTPGFVTRGARLDYGRPVDIDVDGLPMVASYAPHMASGSQAAEIPLPEDLDPGLYVVEAGSPRVGAARTLVILSDYALVAKPGLQRVTVWAASVPDGVVAPEARVRLHDEDGRVLGAAGGDERGVARLDRPDDAVFASALVDGQVTVVGLLRPWISRGAYYWWNPGSVAPLPTHVGHVHTDRPIYRPGHTARYKATLRRIGDDGYDPPAPGTPVTVTVRDGAGNAVATHELVTDGWGAVDGAVEVGDEAVLGTWRLEVAVAGQSLGGSFEVQAYVKPDYEVTVDSDRAWYVTGDAAQVTVQADYYFGQPVTDGEVTLRVYAGWYRRGGEPIAELRGRTDAQGSWTVGAALPAVANGSQHVTFEAEVADATRRPVVGSSAAVVHHADVALRSWAERYGVEAGEPVVILSEVRDHDGVAVADHDVTVEVLSYAYDRGYETRQRAVVRTDATGMARAEFALGAGWYRVVTSTDDRRGQRLTWNAYAWVTDPRYPWYWHDTLAVTTDRESYSPGDTATLLIRSPVTSTALVTLERGDVVDEIVVDVAGATEVQVPIVAAHAPNVWAKVQVWNPVREGDVGYGDSAAAARLYTAQINLPVSAARKRLDVQIAADAAEYGPGDTASYEITVHDAAGRPVAAQLSVAAVDEAVLALAQDRSGDVFDAFWGNRANNVTTFDSLRPSDWTAYPERDAERGPPPGATAPAAPTGEPPGQGEDTPGEAAPRTEFVDTAYWHPTVETDDTGKATVAFTLPDNLTTWRLLARAVDMSSRAGQGETETLVTQPVIASPALPRFAVQGDTFALDVLARNYTPSTVAAECAVEAPGLTILDPGTRSLELPVNATLFGRWSVVASELGTQPVSARVTSGAGGDAVELPFEVQPFAVPERFAVSGTAEVTATETVTVPFHAVPASSTVEVRLSAGVAAGVVDGLEYLIGFPYGCVEQTMSRLMPDAVVGRLILELDLPPPDFAAELPEMIALGVQKIYGFQNPDGGWGWWHGSSNMFTSAYVLHGLALVQEAGEEVDRGVVERGLAYLEGQMTAPSDERDADARVRSYAAYVLTLHGRGSPDRTLELYAERADLDVVSRAALALALHGHGRAAESALVLDEIEAAAVTTDTTAHWPLADDGTRTGRRYWWYTMASREKNTAMALNALANLRPASPLAPKAARWLLEHRSGRAWRTTQATSFAVLALTDYLVASGELWSAYDWQVSLDGAPVAAGHVDATNVMEPIAPLVLPGDALGPGTHEVLFEKDGSGTLFYTVAGRLALYHEGFAAAQPEDLGIAVSRSYHPVAGRSDAHGWHVGDVVNVRLTVDVDDDVWYVLIEDRLPAGFEALNDRLDTETGRLPPSDPRVPWRWRGYERKELRDDRVTFFSTLLTPGTHVFEYPVRAVTPGAFSALPAEAYAMYRPDVWGRSASTRVLVAADQVQDRPPLSGDFDRDCRLTGFDAALVAAAWGGGTSRDVNGDGRLDAADLALATARSGAACGDPIGPAPSSSAEVALELRWQPSVPGDDTRRADIVARAANVNVAAYDLTLDVGSGARVVAARDALLPRGHGLGPVGSTSQVRIAAYQAGGRRIRGEAVLAHLHVRGPGSGTLTVARGIAASDEGAEHVVTFADATISPAPRALETLLLPNLRAP